MAEEVLDHKANVMRSGTYNKPRIRIHEEALQRVVDQEEAIEVMVKEEEKEIALCRPGYKEFLDDLLDQ